MVNELKELMRENVGSPPPDHLDPVALVSAGRRRVHRRRAAVVGGVSLLAAGAVAITAVGWPQGTPQAGVTGEPPLPDAPTLHLSDATKAVPGRDYTVQSSYTNQDLDADNGQYYDGVTDDGMILFRDGPRADLLHPRYALMDPKTGAKDWLPDPGTGQSQSWPVELGQDRLVLIGAGGDRSTQFVAHVFDRSTRTWADLHWPGLPGVAGPRGVVSPDGRLYVSVPATQGKPPEGGWPVGPDGEADDADAAGDTYELWSVSLTDESDVRDEGLRVGDVAFTDTSMVWTDSTNGDAGRVHVRDLASGEEHSFDPQSGEKCNLLSFGATGDHVVLGQYCGTYTDGVRDDRVQILSTDGAQVVTLQDNGIDGALAGLGGSNDLVLVDSYTPKHGGTYVYDVASETFLRVSNASSRWGLHGPTPPGQFLWDTPVNKGHGATQWLGQLHS